MNEYVSNNICVACPAGTTNDAGDAAAGSDTVCSATLCNANEYVSNHVCVACATGFENDSGDDGSDTICDVTFVM